MPGHYRGNISSSLDYRRDGLGSPDYRSDFSGVQTAGEIAPAVQTPRSLLHTSLEQSLGGPRNIDKGEDLGRL